MRHIPRASDDREDPSPSDRATGVRSLSFVPVLGTVGKLIRKARSGASPVVKAVSEPAPVIPEWDREVKGLCAQSQVLFFLQHRGEPYIRSRRTRTRHHEPDSGAEP